MNKLAISRPKESIVIKRSLIFILPLLSLVTVVTAIIYYKDLEKEKLRIESNEANIVTQIDNFIQTSIKSVSSDLMILANKEEIRDYLQTGAEVHREALTREFLTYSYRKKQYDQIRFIDDAGMEVIRINFEKGNPRVVPQKELQFKGKRYYFQDTFQLDKEEIFVSPFDLNIERGEIERPLKPMIRFGTTIFDSEGTKRGIVILNYLGAEILNDISRISESTLGDLMLLNSDGYWLKGTKADNEWGFMMKDRKDRTYGNAFPDAWRQINNSDSGQIYTEDGLCTFDTVYPITEAQKSSSGAAGAFESSEGLVRANEYYWKVVSHVPHALLIAGPRNTLKRLLLFDSFLVVLIILGSLFIAKSGAARQRAVEKLKEAQYELENRVNERTKELIETVEKLEDQITERKTAEEALQKSEKRLSLLAEVAFDGIVVTEKGVILEANEEFAKIFGYSCSEMIGMHVSNIIAPDYEEYAMEKIKSGYDMPYESVCLKKEGTRFPVEVYGKNFSFDERTLRITAIRDISQRKKLVEDLTRESQINAAMAELSAALISEETIDQIGWRVLEQGKALTGSIHGFVGYVDQATGHFVASTFTRDIWEQCRVLEKEVVFKKYHGLWGWVLKNRVPLMTNSPNDDPRSSGVPEGHIPIRRFMSAPAMAEDVLIGQIALANADHDYTDDDLELIKRLATLYSIAIIRRRAQESLELSQQRLEEAQYTAHLGSWEWDKGRNTIICSAELYRILGLEPRKGEQPFDFFLERLHPTDRDSVSALIQESVDNGKPFSEEFLIIKPDGEERTILAHGTARVNKDKTISGLMGTALDITERKHLEEELMKHQKLESIGILAGGIAHDFNNLLTAIMNNVYLSKQNLESDSKAFDRLENAEKAIIKASNLTQQLLTYSRGGSPVKLTISLEQLIKDTADFALRGSKCKCDIKIAEDLWNVEVDEGQINQVIHNLIINADQAMPEGGLISIHAVNTMAEAGTEIACEQEKYVKVTIQDHGTGIPREDLQKIFDPYFTTKETGQGLGLAISFSIIKNHKGHVTVESDPGSGTTFTILLPASESAASEKETDERAVSQTKLAGKILIMDDEEMVRDSLKQMIAMMGCEVECAKDGREAVELYEHAMKLSKPYDALILDLTVPGGMGGEEAIKKLHKINPDIKAVVSSGYSDDTVMAKFREYGFSDIIIKPYKPQELERVLIKSLKGQISI